MLAHGHGDGLVDGATRKSAMCFERLNHVFDAKRPTMVRRHDRVCAQGAGSYLIGDYRWCTNWPNEEDRANIAEKRG